MHQSQEFPDIIGAFLHRTHAKYLLSGRCINPSIFHISRIAATSSIDCQTFIDRLQRNSLGRRTHHLFKCIFIGRAAFDVFRIILSERLICLLYRFKGFIFSIMERIDLLFAIRQIKYEVGEENCCYIHLTLVPYIETANELKTKPTQHSVKELHELGIIPNIIMLRTEHPIDDQTREKLANFCNVDPAHIIQNLNARSIYEVPLQLEKEGLGKAVCTALGIKKGPADLSEWTRVVERFNNPEKNIKIALVGKYVALHDAYLSVVESLIHGGIENLASIDIDWVSSEDLTDDEATENRLKDADAVIVPGGFGGRGIEGMVNTAKYCRTHNVPYFGICLGMQIVCIEYARNVLGFADANSTEMEPETTHPVIDLMPDQNGKILGGTLRLGKFECSVAPETKTAQAYGSKTIWERHRHRYEFNNVYREDFKKGGLIIAGVNPERDLVEIVEVPGHQWMVGVQFHPEFKSRPNKAGPLFREFVRAACENKENKKNKN